MSSLGLHRPRNLDWKRAAALLYGDWGTSKAYVIGLAFVAAHYSSLPIILAMCGLTALVGWNYIIICKYYPDGGGVYSSAKSQSRLLAVFGALLLVADLTVTAALSGWNGMTYFGVPKTLRRYGYHVLILALGGLNYFGPKHSGSFAISLALPMAITVLVIIALSVPYLSPEHLRPSPLSVKDNWVAFTGVILALSGVEAVANLTGVMRLDKNATLEQPKVAWTARRAILPVMLEVVLGTALLGWAMLSLPVHLEPQLNERWEDMLRFLAEEYGAMTFGITLGKIFGVVVGVIVGLLAAQRGQHRHRRLDRRDVHDGARRRNAQEPGPSQRSRRALVAADHRGGIAFGGGGSGAKSGNLGRPLCHRCGRGHHRQPRLVHLQQASAAGLVGAAV